MRSSNPILKEKAFEERAYLTGQNPNDMMTIRGTLDKALLLFAILVGSALGGSALLMVNPGLGGALAFAGMGAGLVMAIVLAFKKELAPILAPLYAIVEGVFVGVFSRYAETLTVKQTGNGVVLTAIVATFAIMGVMLALYRFKVIRATPVFTRVVVTLTLGIAVTYFVSLGMFLVTGSGLPILWDASPIGIAVTVGIIIVAALNFVLDFDLIERGSAAGAPKYMEWYAAFGLLVTLVWLYLEMVRLLMKLRR